MTVDISTMHPRQQEVLATVPDEDRQAVINRARLLQNLQGGVFSSCLWTAAAEVKRLGAHEVERQSREDNVAAMRACGCSACARDAARMGGAR